MSIPIAIVSVLIVAAASLTVFLGFAVPKSEHAILSTERRVVRWRDHWTRLALVAAETTAGIFALATVSYGVSLLGHTWLIQSVLWYTAVGLLVRFAWVLWNWWDSVLVVTDKRFMRIFGVLSWRNDMMPVKKLTDMTFNRTTLGLLFGYGDIRIESAGQTQSLEHIRFVPDPDAVFEAIAKLVFSDELPPPKRGPKVRGFRWRKRKLPSLDDRSDEWPVTDEEKED